MSPPPSAAGPPPGSEEPPDRTTVRATWGGGRERGRQGERGANRPAPRPPAQDHPFDEELLDRDPGNARAFVGDVYYDVLPAAPA